MRSNISIEDADRPYILGIFFLGLGVALGAFGAHAIKDSIEAKYFLTYQVGVTYQFYHGFALIILGLIKQAKPDISITTPVRCFSIGILLFSFNCYIYALTAVKTFAMIIPLGGSLFIIGWLALLTNFLRKRK